MVDDAVRGSPRTVAAVLACHNRRTQTLSCLASLAAQRSASLIVTPYVLDDGSTDGTAERVAESHPDAVVMRGDGSRFWNGGMRDALAVALVDDHDFYLWLNDDTGLDADALARLVGTHDELAADGQSPIVVGSTRDPESGEVTYGGRERRSGWRRMRFSVVEPSASPVQTETMNGNIVLVPREVAREVGNLDPAYVHAFGDEDYGLRARRHGFDVWVAPGTLGTCPRNAEPAYGQQSLLTEFRAMMSVKGLPPRCWAAFTRRWAGPAWPLYWISPYLRRTLEILRVRVPRSLGARKLS